MLYLAVALICLLAGGGLVAFLLRQREVTLTPATLEESWERMHESDKKLQDSMDPADYLDSGLDGLR